MKRQANYGAESGSRSSIAYDVQYGASRLREQIDANLDEIESSLQSAGDPHSLQTGEPTRELVFVDDRVDDLATLLEDLQSLGTELEIIQLDSSRDGVSQISTAAEVQLGSSV